VLEGVSLTAAMQRCIDWDYDCEAVRPVGSTFELYTQLWAVPRAAAWQKLSCCEADSSGKCSLPDGRFTAGFNVGDILVSEEAVAFINHTVQEFRRQTSKEMNV
ncbi:unnamed protein product, partial [Symbiodinium pilosum]